MIGKKLSPILEELELKIIEHDFYNNTKPCYTSGAFRAASKIFMSVLMDKMWELQQSEDIDIEDRLNMVTKAGVELRAFIKTYTGIDTYNLYKNEKE